MTLLFKCCCWNLQQLDSKLLLTCKLKCGLFAQNTTKQVGDKALVLPRIFCFTGIINDKASFYQAVTVITVNVDLGSIPQPSEKESRGSCCFLIIHFKKTYKICFIYQYFIYLLSIVIVIILLLVYINKAVTYVFAFLDWLLLTQNNKKW